ncbi:MAG: sulfatase [Planctomycetes bacterium]|nr:sulfatase [Planctomycetota bacterium]
MKVVGLTTTGIALGGCQSAPAGKRPNVVVILTDDQRDDCVGVHPRPLLGIKTPHLDRLAREGALFENMFVTTSLCSPSRASFLSGLYAHSHGVVNNFTHYPVELASYPRRLQEAGYNTAYIGKWHMGEQDDEKRPGFDYWITHKGQGKYYDTTFNINGTRKEVKGYYTRVVTDMVIDWLKNDRIANKPFMLIFGQKAPHGPFVPEEKYKHTYDSAPVPYPESAFDLATKPKWVTERLDTWHGIYGPLYGFRKNFPDRRPEGVDRFVDFVRSYTGTINSVDDSVGAVYDALQEMGILDDTLFVFTSDNGFLLGEHGMIDKRTMHEASIRVPLIVRYPGLAKPGTRIKEQVLNIDLAPSIVQVCGAEPLKNIHGASWVKLLKGNAGGWRKAWMYEYNYEKQFPYTPNVRGVRTDEWKYVHYPHGDGTADRHMAELYNLKDDPGERKNLIDDPKYADVVKDMQAHLERLLKETDALPDRMPIDEGVKTELPEESIR